MTSKPQPQLATPVPEESLAEALEQNKEAAAAVEEVAEELAVVRTVLSTKLKNVEIGDDFSNAVERTKTLEVKLVDTVEKMDLVNRTLANQQATREHFLST